MPAWKSTLVALFAGGSLTALSWGFKMLLAPGRSLGFRRDPPDFPPLEAGDVFWGIAMASIYFWYRWAWRPRRKHARWHRWLVGLAHAAFVGVWMLWVGIRSWNVLLPRPWGEAVSVLLVGLFLGAWALPVLSERWAMRIAAAQDALDLRILGCAGTGVGGLMVTAGILGAQLGMALRRHVGIGAALLSMGLLFSFLAIALAQHTAAYFYSWRPWAKEEESCSGRGSE